MEKKHRQPAPRPWWSDAAVAIFAAALGVAGGLAGTHMSLSAARERETRDIRRPVYRTYIDQAGAFATAVMTVRQCDVRGVPRSSCEVTEGQLQHLRHDLQGATNEMHTMASNEAIEALREVAATLPPTLIGLTGDPVVDDVDEPAFRRAFEVFADVMRCDTSPEPPTGC
ncbi:hypothetical protein [Cellulomonas iranensis]|uniref:hypothetical protein n=1 Tax=Cellulomonas iranensis TaxID=76862 RepID=UPI0013D67C5D|nr:hypothetical protein [Cellulomonas iranensis]